MLLRVTIVSENGQSLLSLNLGEICSKPLSKNNMAVIILGTA